MLGVPVDDDCGEQVQSGHAEMLAFGGPIADFTLAADTEGVLQSVMGLALVETDLGAALHVGIEQPVDDEERPFDPSDFPQSDRQFMLPGRGCELLQELAWGHRPRHQGGCAAQDIRPVRGDETVSDLAADQPFPLFRAGGRIEDIPAL